MTPTNHEIYMAAITLLRDAGLPYTILWQGFGGEPPATDAWIEDSFFPNEGIDNGLSYSDGVTPQGIIQFQCFDRPSRKRGMSKIREMADELKSIFKKGQPITGMVRVIRTPYDMELDPQDDRMSIVVTIEYSG